MTFYDLASEVMQQHFHLLNWSNAHPDSESGDLDAISRLEECQHICSNDSETPQSPYISPLYLRL